MKKKMFILTLSKTGVLRCDKYTGPTEALIATICCYLLTAIFGQDFWHINLTQNQYIWLPYEIRIYYIPVIGMTLSLIPSIITK
jgi:hypothetical protein